MKLQVTFALAVVLASGCANIERTSTAEQAIGQQAIAGVGDVVLRVDNHKNLVNALGKADIFGRKTHTGFSELRFSGVEPSGEIVLYRKDVQIVTNETTMSRTPVAITTGSASTTTAGNYQGTAASGRIRANSKTSSVATTIGPASDFHVVVPSDTIAIRLAPGETKVPMSGHVVEVIKASPAALEYKVTRTDLAR